MEGFDEAAQLLRRKIDVEERWHETEDPNNPLQEGKGKPRKI